jgi:hypothetical protein
VWGKLPATDVQAFARAATLDGCCHPELKALASLGSFGHNPSHVHQQLVDRFTKASQLPVPVEIAVPAIDSRGDSTVSIEGKAGILYPHDWWASLGHHYPKEFDRIFGTGELSAFWAEQDVSNPKLRGHPVLKVLDYDKLFLPFYFHGDGVALRHDNTDVHTCKGNEFVAW